MERPELLSQIEEAWGIPCTVRRANGFGAVTLAHLDHSAAKHPHATEGKATEGNA